jgi:hypothetical protein
MAKRSAQRGNIFGYQHRPAGGKQSAGSGGNRQQWKNVFAI